MEESKSGTYRVHSRKYRYPNGRTKKIIYKYKSAPKTDIQLEKDVFLLLEKAIDTYKKMSKPRQLESLSRMLSRLEMLDNTPQTPLTKARKDFLGSS